MKDEGRRTRGERGAALMLAFALLLTVVLFATAAVVFIDFQAGFADRLIKNTQSLYLAEAGYVYAMKRVYDAKTKGVDPITLFPMSFTETLGGAAKKVTIRATPSGTDKYIFQCEVE